MRRVIVESPFAGKTPADVARNVRYVRACLRDVVLRGETPYASHALLTLAGVLDDDKPEERKLGMEAGWAWMLSADLVAVYLDLGMSKGMTQGLERAKLHGKTIEERKLGGVWADGRGPDCLHAGAVCHHCGEVLSPLNAALAATKVKL